MADTDETRHTPEGSGAVRPPLSVNDLPAALDSDSPPPPADPFTPPSLNGRVHLDLPDPSPPMPYEAQLEDMRGELAGLTRQVQAINIGLLAASLSLILLVSAVARLMRNGSVPGASPTV